MNLTSISQRFPDQQACIKYLEEKRWGEQPCCPHCGSQRVAQKQEGKRIGRWNCHGCKSSFKAAVIGAVERGGRVVARLARGLSGKGIFFQEAVSPRQTVVITDAYLPTARQHRRATTMG